MQERIFSIDSEEKFNEVCLEVYHYQKVNCPVYGKYVDLLGKAKTDINHYTQIPFLPIDFFKTQQILAEGHQAEITFTSSGTTGMVTSQHQVADLSWYEKSFRSCFQRFYGEVENIAVLALLPSYLERSGSSLIYMVDDLIEGSQHPSSGYFLYNHEDLCSTLLELKKSGTKTLLIGVTYALLDFCEQYQVDFSNLMVMETGGMKGKRKEMIREELHRILTKGFGVEKIHSEYGMTELLSQGYSFGDGIFRTPPWMKVLMRDTNDPLSLIEHGKTGAINVIDLANYYSCSFIATQDLGKLHEEGSFEILGRFDNSDIRGCNLLVQ
ncbi:LuxE/PaaK family acyltransferase [Sphingobacterium chuzhouense]|uniref:Acyl transferase n=1 Tax=Sphingobacterium chuzhouense TaxID=1742264 RepID=A0ABR7XRP5_9SPHI|nr:acyl transferase [Sphingobacterium chuzhouense]MBD1421818.1 acyl transferase [Sphingobacterium chuzhouense]